MGISTLTYKLEYSLKYHSQLRRGITPHVIPRLVGVNIWVTGSHSCRYNVRAFVFLFLFFSSQLKNLAFLNNGIYGQCKSVTNLLARISATKTKLSSLLVATSFPMAQVVDEDNFLSHWWLDYTS